MRTTTQLAKNFGIHFSLILLSFLAADGVLAQGSLTPPGVPAPTMKTLEQIEPRIDLQNAPASAVTTTDANFHYIITQPGSYYLSANLGVTKLNGIQINAEGVTLDLNGFEISRASGSGGNGIEIAATSHRASVRNGSLKAFAYGLRSLGAAAGARGCAFRELSASNCTTAGMFVGEGAVLESCRALSNSGDYGIYADSGSSLTNCTATANTGSAGLYASKGSSLTNCSAEKNIATYGLFAGEGSSLTNCSASSNSGEYGIFAGNGSSLTNCSAANNITTYGIYARRGSSLTNCSAMNNDSAATSSAGIGTDAGCTISQCSAYANTSSAPGVSTPTTGMGFDVGSSSTIRDSTAHANKGDGIKISFRTGALNNTSSENGADGAGIHAIGNDNRIEGNNVTDNARGIDVDSSGNLIIKNSARGNTTNYSIVGGNADAAIVPSGSGFTSTNPWGNFSY